MSLVTEWIGVAPLLILLVGGLLAMLVDAFSDKDDDTVLLVLTAFLASTAMSIGLALGKVPAAAPVFVTNYLAIDSFSYFFDILIGGSGALTTLVASNYLTEHRLFRGEFFILLLFSAFGAMGLAHANDFVSAFISLETMSLGVYALVGFRRTSSRATESAVKYFLLGSFASAILLFGAGLLYGATGATSFSGVAEGISSGMTPWGGRNTTLVLLSMVFVVGGVAFKVGAVPFHMWTPDAYEGAPTPTTSFMSVAVKAAAFALALRLLGVVFGDEISQSFVSGWPPVVAALAVLSMVVGNLAAILQTNVKRMLAYSSVAHAGYILVGIAVIPIVGEAATSAVLVYLLTYTVSSLLALGALVWVGSRGKEAVSYEDLAGLGRRHPLVGIPFVLGIFSLMGMPPTAGFVGKYLVFSAAVSAGGGFVWLAVLGVVFSAIGAYYYLKVLVYLFMRDPEPDSPVAVPMKRFFVPLSLLVAGYFVIKIGMTPNPYIDLALGAARSLIS